ncbi:MAG: hypothetical protein R2726_16770 [Acidimicrobiales bacterium]
MTTTRRLAVVSAVVASAIAAVFVVARVAGQEVPPPTDPRPWNVFVDTYWPPDSSLEATANVSDGQAWAAFGDDPTYSHPEHFYGGTVEFVYRAQRPLYGWLVWLGAGGQGGAVAWSLAVLTCLAVGALAAAAVVLADRIGRVRRYAPLVCLMPGVFLSVVLLHPEPLSVALGLAGLTFWLSEPRRVWLAVLAFTLAALGRELLLLFPLGLALQELIVRRERPGRLVPLTVPFVAYIAWIASLRVRFGSWPSDRQGLSSYGWPFVGWYQSIGDLDPIRTGSYVLGVVLLVLAVRRDPRSPLTWIALGLALSTVFMGSYVLGTEPYRPLLAMYVLGLLAALPREQPIRRAVPDRRIRA